MLGTLSGLAVVLAFLLLSVDVLVELHARSAITAVAYDAARDVALAGDEAHSERGRAEQRARRALGSVGEDASFSWRSDAEEVTLRVQVTRRGALLAALGLRPRRFDRTVTVRREVLR